MSPNVPSKSPVLDQTSEAAARLAKDSKLAIEAQEASTGFGTEYCSIVKYETEPNFAHDFVLPHPSREIIFVSFFLLPS